MSLYRSNRTSAVQQGVVLRSVLALSALVVTLLVAAQGADAYSVDAMKLTVTESGGNVTVADYPGNDAKLGVMVCGANDVRIFKDYGYVYDDYGNSLGSVGADAATDATPSRTALMPEKTFSSPYADCRRPATAGALSGVVECQVASPPSTCDDKWDAIKVAPAAGGSVKLALGDGGDAAILAGWEQATTNATPAVELDGGTGLSNFIDLGSGMRVTPAAALSKSQMLDNAEPLVAAMFDSSNSGYASSAMIGSALWPVLSNAEILCVCVGDQNFSTPIGTTRGAWNDCDDVTIPTDKSLLAPRTSAREVSDIFNGLQGTNNAFGIVASGDYPTTRTTFSGTGGGYISYETRSANLNVNLDNSANDGQAGENDLIGPSFSTIKTGIGNDTITGSSSADKIFPGRGNDTLNAGAGDDTISMRTGYTNLAGLAGNDSINGGAGKDRLSAKQRWIATGSLGTSITLSDPTGPSSTVGLADLESLELGSGASALTDGGDFTDYDLGDGIDQLTLTGTGADATDFAAGTPRDASNRYRKSYKVNLSLGTDTLNGSTESLREDVSGELDAENVPSAEWSTKFGADTFNDPGNATGNPKTVKFFGGAGNDTLNANTNGGNLPGAYSPNSIYFEGRAGNDRLLTGANAGAVYATGDGGSDTIQGSPYADEVLDDAANGAYVNFVFASTNSITTYGGSDRVSVTNTGSTSGTPHAFQTNSIDTGDDDDLVELTGRSNDTVLTGNGNDEIQTTPYYNGSTAGNAGQDALDGGNGEDLLEYKKANGSLSGDLATGVNRTFGSTTERDTLGNLESLMIREFNASSKVSSTLTSGGAFHEFYLGNGNNTVTLDGKYLSGLGGSILGTHNSNWWKYGYRENTNFGTQKPDANGALVPYPKQYYVVSGTGNDTVNTNARSNAEWITLGDGNNRSQDQSVPENQLARTKLEVYGGSGTDVIVAKRQADTSRSILNGGAGTDTILGLDQDLRPFDSLQETIYGGAGNDSIDGQSGNDEIYGGDGNDELSGSDGNDTIAAGNGDDAAIGGSGDDTLNGESGKDSLFGGDGADILRGGIGDDDLNGTDGNDRYVAEATADGRDLITDNSGTDTADYSNRTAAVTVDPNVADGDGATGENDDVPDVIETVIGGSENDSLTVSRKRSGTLRGLGGDDTLHTMSSFGDTVDCGNGTDDTAFMDRFDTAEANNDCETDIFGEVVQNTELPELKVRRGAAIGTRSSMVLIPGRTVLGVSDGTWQGKPTPSVSLVWQRCKADLSTCSDIAGETTDEYRIAEEDRGFRFRVRAVGTNAFGQAHVFSNPSEIVPSNTPKEVDPVDPNRPATTTPQDDTDASGRQTQAAESLREPTRCLDILAKRQIKSRSLRLMRGVKARVYLHQPATIGHPSKPVIDENRPIVARLALLGKRSRVNYQRSKLGKYASRLTLKFKGQGLLKFRVGSGRAEWKGNLNPKSFQLGRNRPILNVKLRNGVKQSRKTGTVNIKRRFQLLFGVSCARGGK